MAYKLVDIQGELRLDQGTIEVGCRNLAGVIQRAGLDAAATAQYNQVRGVNVRVTVERLD